MRLFLLTLLSLVSLPVRAQLLADVTGIRAGVEDDEVVNDFEKAFFLAEAE